MGLKSKVEKQMRGMKLQKKLQKDYSILESSLERTYK